MTRIALRVTLRSVSVRSHVPGGAARERARASERSDRRVGAAFQTDTRREDGRARWTREISSAGRRGAVEPAHVGKQRGACKLWPSQVSGLSGFAGGPHQRTHPADSSNHQSA